MSKTLLIYGKHPVIEVIKHDKRSIKHIFATQHTVDQLTTVINTHNPTQLKKLQLINETTLNKKFIHHVNHQHCAIEASYNTYYNLEHLKDLNSNITTVLLLSNLTDVNNIGNIIRSAVAFNINNIIIPNHKYPKESAAMIKASAGATEQANLFSVNNLKHAINILKEQEFWIAGLDNQGSKPPNHMHQYHKLAFLVGSENSGIKQSLHKYCDFNLKIPMANHNIDSLNVAIATGVIMYERYCNNTQIK